MCPPSHKPGAALGVGVKIQPWPLAAQPAVNICGVGVTPEILVGLFRGDVSFQQPHWCWWCWGGVLQLCPWLSLPPGMNLSGL